MPKNRKLQNIISTEHITDTAEAAIAAQAGSGNVVDDTTPQLGGNLDVNGNAVVSTVNGNIELNPNGTGKVVFKGNATKGAGQFILNCEQNSHGIVIKGPPHSAAASYTLTLPDDDGAANEVLKTDGSGNLDWVAQSGGGSSQINHTPQLAVPLFDAAGGVITVYPLLASGQSGYSTTSNLWNDSVGTTIIFLWPCIAAKTGTINGLQLRTGPSAGDDLHIGLYKSDANGFPNGAAAFSTTISTSANTSYSPTISVSGVTKGDILYFATFGQNDRTNLRVTDVSRGGTFTVPRGVTSVNWSAGGNQQIIRLSGQTNGVFPTLSSSTAYTGTGEPSYVPRIGISYS